MTVWIFERNLLWSARLKNALATLGHAPRLCGALPEDGGADLAIVNLGEGDRIESLVPALKARGVPVLAHAGHREKELLALGKSLGVDRLATNGQMANDLERVLGRMVSAEDDGD